MERKSKPVKNLSSGRQGYRPIGIVIHIIDGRNMSGAYHWFNNPDSQASAHYGVRKNGEVWQFVQEQDTAWHAGGVNQPSWRLLKPGLNPNLYTIGIEHEGRPGEEFTEAMYESSSQLIANIADRWHLRINRDHIIGHNEINSVTRPNCPGTGVNLDKLVKMAYDKSDRSKMIEQLQKDNQNLRDRLRDLQVHNQQLETQLKDITATNHRLERRVDELQKQLSDRNYTSTNPASSTEKPKQRKRFRDVIIEMLEQFL